MSQITDAGHVKELARRLKELRERRHLSQEALAKKSGVSAQQIWRIETGETGKQKTVRALTVERLACALGVAPEILTGQAPLPEPEPTRTVRKSDEDYSINVSVDGAVRNAFTLVAMRYRVPIARIVELAPFLFVVAAEASLERRRDIAKNLEEAFDHARSLVLSRPYHSIDYWLYDDALASEKRSISTRDLLGDTLSGQPSEYDESQHNPFVTYLEDAAPSDAGVTSIRRFDRASVEFEVCREDVLKLTGGDEELTESVLAGEVILHAMPRELFNSDAADARVAWLREKRDAHRAAAIISTVDLL
jgi:transcriptional regulator with XRE-family HTH domain